MVRSRLSRARPRRLAALGLALALGAAACGDTDSSVQDQTTTSPTTTATTTPPTTTAPTTTAPAPTTTTLPPEPMSTLQIEPSGLEPLADGFHYEGWAIVDGAPVTTGKFNIGSDGALVSLDGASIDTFTPGLDLTTAEAVVITIEPAGDTDDVPATTKILGGPVVNGVAELTVAHPATLADDFLAAGGTFLLATPTDDSDANELSGVWFLEIGPNRPSLSLPTLPDGWAYEGWVVIDGTPVTTGTFTAVDMADDAAPFSGPNSGPPFPGEDFLVNAPSGLTFPVNLSGMTVVISVEPVPDDSPLPFVLKPLIGPVPDSPADHVSYDLGNNAAGFPTAVARIT